MKKFNQKKNDIVLRAARIFDLWGYEDTSMSKIATEIGCSKASLYYYFKSKEELFLNVLASEGNRYFNENRKYFEHETDLLKKLYFYLTVPLSLTEQHNRIIMKIVLKLKRVGVGRIEKLISELNDRFVDGLRSLLIEGIETGIFRKDLEIDFFIKGMIMNIGSYLIYESARVINVDSVEKRRLTYKYMLSVVFEGIKNKDL